MSRNRIVTIATVVVIAATGGRALPAQTFDPAKDDVTTLLATPPDGVAWFELRNRAISLSNQRKWSEAEPLFEQLVREYPRDGMAWILLGNLKGNLKKPAEAAAAFERAGAIVGWGPPWNPRLQVALYRLAAGDRTGAMNAVREEVLGDGRTVLRRWVYDLPELAALRDDPEFKRITMHEEVTGVSRTEGWRADIDALYAEVARTNPDYRGKPLPAEVTRRYTELKRRVPELKDEEIFVGMGRMLAPMHAGHTSLFAPPASRFLPLRPYLFPQGAYIIQADSANAALVGARIVAIGSLPVDEALKRIALTRSVDGAMQHAWGISDLAVSWYLVGIGAVVSNDTIPMVVEARDGTRRTVRVATTAKALPGRQDRMVAPTGIEAPMYLARMDEMHWERPLPEHDALYVQVNNISNDPDETLAAFGRRLATVLSTMKASNLVIDLRHNNGGNTNLYLELLRTIVAFSREPGHQVYAVIGRRSYSATANFITDLERLASPVFVGEASSECCNFFGDPSHIVLPYSRIEGELTGVRWNFSRNVFDGRREMSPHVPVQLTAADYFAGRDPALDAVFRVIAKSKVASTP